ncbi:c-type cytochrome [Candidatus Magnetominusculus dajiuhuensis]|uniref:c-type cytochrome n=1 Tax=Candidatus Magnetominusculus dajiuhuensis TaxID=3137712 RepID=UPI003B438131
MRIFYYALVLVLSVFMASAVLYAENIENGEKLFKDTKLGGSASGKSCNSCHAAGKGIDLAKFNNSSNPDDIVNKCIVGALKGKALAKDSIEMKDMVAYIKSLGNKK